LALAFILAVTASLLVAMTATPAMCALLLRDGLRTRIPLAVVDEKAAGQGGAVGRDHLKLSAPW